MKKISQDLLNEVSTVVSQLNDKDYSMALPVLNGNSIGKHVRHMLDLFECLIENSESGTINYDLRKRNPETESSKEVALIQIENTVKNIDKLDLGKNILLRQTLNNVPCEINSSTKRELLYNIEHCIHHLAIIKIGIENNFGYVQIPENFGVAYSTLSHREQAAD